jgi:multiple sugar transport system permease protein
MLTADGKNGVAAPEPKDSPTDSLVGRARSRDGLHRLMRRKSTIAFLMTLPLITLLIVLVAYPAGSAIHLSMLDRRMTKLVGLDNFVRLFGSDRFWVLACQTSLLAITAVICQAIIGFAAAHFMHNIPNRGQRKWRGLLLVPWVIPPLMGTLAWRQLFDPSFSAFNWILEHVGIERISWLAEAGWARFVVILVTVWFGAPFFMLMYLAALKSVPDELYEASSIDGATWWQRTWYVTLPLTRDLIAITMLFSLISGFAGFTIVNVLTNGGPLGATQLLATAAFYIAFGSGNFPMGAAVSLCMVPILTVAATFILRGIAKRGSGA